MKGVQVVEDMDASASVEMSGLQEPQVVSIKMVHWTSELHVVPLLKVERLELGAFVVGVVFARSLVNC